MALKRTLLASALLGFCSTLSAEIFTASGVGDTPEMARKDAVSNAIKLGVGEYLVSKETLNNEDFNQNIVSHSNAYVESVKMLATTKLPNGSYESTVEVDIKSQKLISQLKGMNVAVLENAVNNESLLKALEHFEAKDSEEKQQADFEQLVEELLITPIVQGEKIYTAEIVGQLKPLKPQPNSETFPFEIEVRFEFSKKYIESYKRIIKQGATSKEKASVGRYIVTRTNEGTKPINNEIYYITYQNQALIDKSVSKAFSTFLGKKYSTPPQPSFEFELLDSNQENIDIISMYIPLSMGDIFEFSSDILLPNNEYREKYIINLTKDQILRLKDIKLHYSDYQP